MTYWAVSKTREGRRWKTLKPAQAEAEAMAKSGLRGVGVRRWDDTGQRLIFEWRHGRLMKFDPLLILSKRGRKIVLEARRVKFATATLHPSSTNV